MEDQRRRAVEANAGSGLFVYKNTTKADMMLSRRTASGKSKVAGGEEFQGDSYYKKFIGQGLALIKTLVTESGEQTIGVPMNEQKLILNQPDCITANGTVEHVQAKKKVNEDATIMPEILLTEDPLEGVEIILN